MHVSMGEAMSDIATSALVTRKQYCIKSLEQMPLNALCRGMYLLNCLGHCCSSLSVETCIPSTRLLSDSVSEICHKHMQRPVELPWSSLI